MEASTTGFYDTSTKYKGKTIKIRLHDGGEDRSRHLTHYIYPISAFILCYAVGNFWMKIEFLTLDDWASLSDLTDWLNEIAFYDFHKTPYVVCACKKDVRNVEKKTKRVGTEEGRLFAREILAKGYFESSTQTQNKEEILSIFEAVYRIGLVELENRVQTWVALREPEAVPEVTTSSASSTGSLWDYVPSFSSIWGAEETSQNTLKT